MRLAQGQVRRLLAGHSRRDAVAAPGPRPRPRAARHPGHARHAPHRHRRDQARRRRRAGLTRRPVTARRPPLGSGACRPTPASPAAEQLPARTAAVWAALDPLVGAGTPLRVLDVGGGSGMFAVPLARLGHDVTVVDPSADALATLRRRADDRRRRRAASTASRATATCCTRSFRPTASDGRHRLRPRAVPLRARGRRRPRRHPRRDQPGAAPRRPGERRRPPTGRAPSSPAPSPGTRSRRWRSSQDRDPAPGPVRAGPPPLHARGPARPGRGRGPAPRALARRLRRRRPARGHLRRRPGGGPRPGAGARRARRPTATSPPACTSSPPARDAGRRPPPDLAVPPGTAPPPSPTCCPAPPPRSASPVERGDLPADPLGLTDGARAAPAGSPSCWSTGSAPTSSRAHAAPRADPRRARAAGRRPVRALPQHHPGQPRHPRHRPAAGQPRHPRLRHRRPGRGPHAQPRPVGRRPRPRRLAGPADRLRAGRRPPGSPSTAVGPYAYAGSGLTRAVYRGAAYTGRGQPRRPRARWRCGALAATPRALVYGYIPELDLTGHVRGRRLARLAGPARAGRRGSSSSSSPACRTTPHCWSPPTTACSTSRPPPASTWTRNPSSPTASVLLAGEPRARYVHAVPGAEDDVLAALARAARRPRVGGQPGRGRRQRALRPGRRRGRRPHRRRRRPGPGHLGAHGHAEREPGPEPAGRLPRLAHRDRARRSRSCSPGAARSA